jgi:Ca2+-binding RTX toxin-like protein
MGQGGNDILTGGLGADLLDGGTGRDRADYRFSKEGVTVDLAKGAGAGGDAEGDVLKAVENISGSNLDDMLTGDDRVNRLVGRQGNDTLLGGAGNDVLVGGSGADHHDGGDGIDTAEYTSSWIGVTVDLLKNYGAGGEAKGDTFTSIENVIGSAFDDMISGDDMVNRLTGGEGDDVLTGKGGNDFLVGGAGADKLDGGEGARDVADYTKASAGVGVDLAAVGFAGEAEGDSFSGIEFVYGSKHADKILGDDAVNRLVGNSGNDYLAGQGGNDYLVGGAGDDILEGGKDADVFVYDSLKFGADTIADFEAGEGRTDRVWLAGQGVASFEEVMKNMTDTDAGAVLTVDGGAILFQGVSAASFAADDFIF